jgi:hypothetical protein
MIHVETIDLFQRGVKLPSDHVRMVIAQPYIPDNSLTATEPYQCTAGAQQQQFDVLTKTLEVSLTIPHGSPKTHFTIFPEYSIPGLEGVEIVETALRADNWPNETIVIGGTDGLTQSQYIQLLDGDLTHVATTFNGGDLVQADQWVNCAITWVKGSDGRVERWIQPKLHPAWAEMDTTCQDMFRGQSVYLFKGQLDNDVPYRFGTLVCFDWIATVGTKKTCRWILGSMQEQATDYQLPLSWLFIIQRNKKPSHETFLTEVEPFFDQTKFPNALRDRACLVFANTAGKLTPGRIDDFGGSSIVLSHLSGFARPHCSPTVSRGGPRFRGGSNLLNSYEDVYFREGGACIHSFLQINPGSLVAGAAGRRLSVENALVFPLHNVDDPRTPAAAVPAGIKWMNDELDEIPSLSVTYHSVSLATQADSAHELNIAAFRGISSPQYAMHAVKMAAQESTSDDVDEWDNIESEALKHLIHTLDIVGIGFPSPTVGTDPAHATVVMNNQTVDLLAIRGMSHEACIEHSRMFLGRPRRQVLLISRDRDNNDWRQKFSSFLQTETTQLGQEQDITDPASVSLHLGYRKLLDIFRQSTTEAILQGAINAELAS